MSPKRERQLERTREVLAAKDGEARAKAKEPETRSADRTPIEEAVRAENKGRSKKSADDRSQ